jgi:hypothetical protein
MHLLVKDFVIGKKLMVIRIVFFFFIHMGNGLCSSHNNAIKCCDNLKNHSQHTEQLIAIENFN